MNIGRMQSSKCTVGPCKLNCDSLDSVDFGRHNNVYCTELIVYKGGDLSKRVMESIIVLLTVNRSTLVKTASYYQRVLLAFTQLYAKEIPTES